MEWKIIVLIAILGLFSSIGIVHTIDVVYRKILSYLIRKMFK